MSRIVLSIMYLVFAWPESFWYELCVLSGIVSVSQCLMRRFLDDTASECVDISYFPEKTSTLRTVTYLQGRFVRYRAQLHFSLERVMAVAFEHRSAKVRVDHELKAKSSSIHYLLFSIFVNFDSLILVIWHTEVFQQD